MKIIYTFLCLITLGIFQVGEVSAQNFCPGSDVIGSGYNVFGEYASTSSVKSPLFDLDKVVSKQMGDNKTYNIPDLLSLKYINKKEYKTSEGRSLRDYASSLNASAGMAYDGLLFQGSIETRFGMDVNSSTNNYFYTVRDLIWIWKVSILDSKKYKLREYLNADAKDAIDNWTPAQLFDVYGTHFVSAGFFGGAMDYNLSEKATSSSVRKSISATVEAKRKSLSGHASSDYNSSHVNNNFARNIKIQACGGDVQYVNKSSVDDNQQYNNWVQSIPSQSVLVDFADKGLRPIWDLASTPARKNKLKNAFKKILKNHPLPEANASYMLTQNQVFFIRPLNAEDRYWDIPGFNYEAKKDGAELGIYKKDDVTGGLQGADRFIKFVPHPTKDGIVYLQPQHSDYVLTYEKPSNSKGKAVSGGRTSMSSGSISGVSNSGYKLVLRKMKANDSKQQFKLMEDKDENTYRIQTVDGKFFLTDFGKKVGFSGKSKSAKQVWYFEEANPETEMAYLPTEVFSIQCLKNKRFIDVPGAAPNQKGKGAPIQLYDMDYQPDRYFYVSASKGSAGVFSLKPCNGNYALDIKGGSKSDRALLQIWDANGSSAQFFKFVYAGAPLTYYIQNVNSGKYLEADNGQIHGNGSKVYQNKLTHKDNQKWKIQISKKWMLPTVGQAFYIKSAYSNKYFDIGGNGPVTNTAGKQLQIWGLDAPEQGDRKFKFVKSNDNSWVFIEIQNGGKYLDIPNNSKNKGEKLIIWNKNQGPSQKFAVSPSSPTTFVLRTKNWKGIDIAGDINKNGTKVIQWNSHNGKNQQLQLIYADGPKKGQVYKFF